VVQDVDFDLLMCLSFRFEFGLTGAMTTWSSSSSVPWLMALSGWRRFCALGLGSLTRFSASPSSDSNGSWLRWRFLIDFLCSSLWSGFGSLTGSSGISGMFLNY
jgi:hypothetical protein